VFIQPFIKRSSSTEAQAFLRALADSLNGDQVSGRLDLYASDTVVKARRTLTHATEKTGVASNVSGLGAIVRIALQNKALFDT
jgi:hypothetical protein